MKINPAEFIHPEDAEALRQMEEITGFPTLVKKFMSLGLERLQYGLNLASCVRLSPKQLPKLYAHLPPICAKLGIPVPEFYLQMSPVPNAWTFGDTRVFITITSALVELLSDEELDSVIAHECGHIACRHVLYHSLAYWLAIGMDTFGLLGKVATPVQLAICYWQRRSELSCDRAASVVTSPETVMRVMARVSGGPVALTKELNPEEWAKQADEYEAICQTNTWDKVLQCTAVMNANHPFAAVRVREILKWGKSEQYRRLKAALTVKKIENGMCPNCSASIDGRWRFCRNCGGKLK